MDETPSKIDLRFAEERVVFAISDCSTGRYSFRGMSRQQAERFVDRLKHVEKMTWKQFGALERTRGLTKEAVESPNFDMIHEKNSSDTKILEQYYFHFRVEQDGLFRVFGYQKGALFCITQIDPDGSINH